MSIEAKIYTKNGVATGQVVHPIEMEQGTAYVQYVVEVQGTSVPLYLPDPGGREALRQIQDITVKLTDI
ncbi:MAG: hypothetical protein NUV98_05945 [Candidatus Roizmanbacteria bacterium]|nr:hypothetical protein [Candidatus Roizmanbacteria bacterium]